MSSDAVESRKCDLLSEPVIRCDIGTLTLPQVFAALAAGQPIEFLALRPHQQHPWHAFLVQVAAITQHRLRWQELPTDPAAWARALGELAGEAADTAWCLVVDDWTQPAFLQPPIPPSQPSLRSEYTTLAETPDEIDLFVASKGHDVKPNHLRAARADDWTFALVTMQTMQGFSGRNWYGIARMNGGFASRPAVAVAPSLAWAERFRRDVEEWRERRDEVARNHGYRSRHALLWLEPWSGHDTAPIESLADLDPCFVEVCRRIRLETCPGGLRGRLASSTTARLPAEEVAGVTGDLWTPLVRTGAGAKALTVDSSGWNYKRVADLLLGGGKPDPISVWASDGPAPVFVGQVLVRGQGKTEGYHERFVPVPSTVAGMLASPSDRDRLAKRARQQIEDAGVAQMKVLHPALCALLQGDPEKLDLRDERTTPWRRRFDEAVDGFFFQDLFAAASDKEEGSQRWRDRLKSLARHELASAQAAAPAPEARAARARALSEWTFERAWHRHFSPPPVTRPSPSMPSEVAP